MCRISKLSLVAFVTFLTGCSTPTSEVQQSQQTQLARAPLSKRAKNLFNALLKSAEPNKGKIKTSDENNGTFESGREIDPSYHYKVDVRMEYPPKYPIEKYSTATETVTVSSIETGINRTESLVYVTQIIPSSESDVKLMQFYKEKLKASGWTITNEGEPFSGLRATLGEDTKLWIHVTPDFDFGKGHELQAELVSTTTKKG